MKNCLIYLNLTQWPMPLSTCSHYCCCHACQCTICAALTGVCGCGVLHAYLVAHHVDHVVGQWQPGPDLSACYQWLFHMVGCACPTSFAKALFHPSHIMLLFLDPPSRVMELTSHMCGGYIRGGIQRILSGGMDPSGCCGR